MQPDFETGLWAVVTAGAEKCIGKIIPLKEEEILTAPMSFKMEFALKLIVMDMPIQGPQGQLGFKHIVQCVPLDNGMHPATIFVQPTAIRYFKEMHEDDRRGHENIVKAAVESLEKARAEAAGIAVPRLIVPPNVRSS